MSEEAKKNRRPYVGGAIYFYEGDLKESVHMTERFALDHVIDLEHMQAALDRTVEIYPHLKDAFVKIGGETFYESCSAPLRVFVGEKVTAPGPGKAAGRTFAVTCHENTVSLSAFHSTFDMVGLNRLACTLLLQYCRIHFGGTYQIPGIPEPDGQEHPEYCADTFALPLGEFQESHGERPEGGTFQVPARMKMAVFKLRKFSPLRMPS